MKCFQVVASVFLFAISICANAVIINDVRTINAIYGSGENILLEFNLADYGFVEGRDSIIGSPTLTIEMRDTEYRPDKDYWEQPFLMIFIDFARYHTRVGIEDWVERGFFNEDGIMRVSINVVEPPAVWFGNITVTGEFLPGPSSIPEPAPFVLLGIGLISIGIIRRFLRNK